MFLLSVISLVMVDSPSPSPSLSNFSRTGSMAWTKFLLILAIFVFAVHLLFNIEIPLPLRERDSGRSEDLPGISGGTNGVLVLSLFQSTSAKNFLPRLADDRSYRRHLEQAGVGNSSSARMPLFDDLLLQGYYTTRLYIGTPPQQFSLIVDTGSTVTYVPVADCEDCGNHQDPKFQPDQSSTFQSIQCSDDCDCDDDRQVCVYERKYAEMSSSSGVLGEDVISFGDESQLNPQPLVFGCETVETGDLFSQRADGIMGLGRGQLSVMDQLVSQGAIADSFSLCYGGMEVGGGAMVLGAYPSPSDMIFTRSDPNRSQYYNIELKELHIGGKPLKLKSKIFDQKHGTVLDSGTTYAYLPEEAFKAFKTAIFEYINHLKKIPGPDPSYKDLCFSGLGRNTSDLSKKFPKVHMVFKTGQKLELHPENYLFKHTKVPGAYCLGIFQNGKDPTTLLGGIIVRDTLVTYDRANERIGFYKTNCSKFGAKLDVDFTAPAPALGASAPASSAHSDKDSSHDDTNKILHQHQHPLAPSPVDAGYHTVTGDFPIGLITFDISCPGGNSSVNLTQLGAYFAKEFGVSASQVQLLHVLREGNDSLAQWAIYPVESSSYISAPKAMSIIMRLSKHDIQVPGMGNYQVVDWKVRPGIEQRSTGSRFKGAVIMAAALLTLVAALSVGYLWVIRTRRRRLNNVFLYQPVGAVAAPEQELQPV